MSLLLDCLRDILKSVGSLSPKMHEEQELRVYNSWTSGVMNTPTCSSFRGFYMTKLTLEKKVK